MPETRPSFSAEEFERYATSREPNWWAVGEKFAYAPEVRAIEGWNVPRSQGNLVLTRAQRDLLVWIELTREASSSCISDFFEEHRVFAAEAEGVVERLGWPEFQQKYSAAARAYMIVGEKSVSAEAWRQEEQDQRERLRKHARAIQRTKGQSPETGEDLDRTVMRMQFRGEIPMEPRRWYEELDEFNQWKRLDATLEASTHHVAAFIRRNQHELAIITE